MCLDMIGRVSEVRSDGTADLDVEGRVRRVSLAVLLLDGTSIGVGDWLQAHTGLAMRVLPADEAAGILRARQEMTGAAGS